MMVIKNQRLVLNLLLLMVLLLGLTSVVRADSEPQTPTLITQDDPTIATTEEALSQTVVPARDLANLAVRLGGVPQIPPAPTTPVNQYQVGDTDTFFIHGDSEVFTIEAELVYVNDVVYMWLETGYTVNATTIAQVANRFATDIYPSVRNVFGNESSPGVDGDTRIHILNSAQLGRGVAGYFYSLHEYPTAAVQVSNAREMFFASVAVLQRDPEFYLSVLAHEFQHMIHFAVDANEQSWINEGLAELAAEEAGFGVSGFAQSYIEVPNVQLTFWPDSNTAPIYGGGYLFVSYLREQFGIEFIRALVQEPANGMDGVARTVETQNIIDTSTGQLFTAENLFRDWSIANYLNDVTVDDGRYGYQNAFLQQLELNALNALSIPASDNRNINQWSIHYYRVPAVAGQNLNIDFKGSQQVQLLPVNAYSGDYAVWSNRANQSNPRLTRSFNLTEVESATLNFWTWYNIEDGWDYAYLVISSDGGATWDIMPTARTTTRNPFGTSYGHGYTGSTEGWVQESVDLSAYAGQEIVVQWEYVTDDAFLLDGMLIDDVSIPEIGYFDDFEGAVEGWLSEGWLRTDNILQQQFSVTLIEHLQDGGARVTPLLSAGEGTTLQQTIPANGDVREYIIAVSAYARATVQQASFDLSLTNE